MTKKSQLNPLSRRRFMQLSSGAALTALVGCSTTNPLIGATKPTSAAQSLSKAEQTWSPYGNSIVIDGLSSAFDNGVTDIEVEMLSLFRRSGITALNATIPYPGDNFAAANNKVTNTIAVINKYSSHLRLINGVDDIFAAKSAKQLGIIMGFQSTEMFGNDVSKITHFAKRGVRYMQLSYNGASQFGDGGLVKANRGLTSLGREAIEVMEANKVLVDLSHSGQNTVAQAIAHSTRPLTISHTGCNGVYRHPRNNDDAELKAVADKGGNIGIYLMPFLEGGDGEITAKMLLNHIDYAINLCGEDHVSIGSDQGIVPVNDGPEYREMIRKDVERRIAAGISAPGETPNRPPFIPELNSERRMELIVWQMKKSGYSDRIIEKVLGQNLLELYRHVW